MNVLGCNLNVNFLPIWWTVLREELEFTFNLFMHVVKVRIKRRAVSLSQLIVKDKLSCGQSKTLHTFFLLRFSFAVAEVFQ